MYLHLGFFLLGALISYVVLLNTRINSEPKHGINMNIVLDSDKCNNQCIHIHHWMFLLVMLLIFLGCNYLLGTKWNPKNMYIVMLYLGSFVSEYIEFGNSIFVIRNKCFNSCNYNKKDSRNIYSNGGLFSHV